MAMLNDKGEWVDNQPTTATPTRADYIAGRCTYEEFYGAVAKDAGVNFNADSWLVKQALVSTDEHYNDIPINRWDAAAAGYRTQIVAALKARGDFWSLSGGLCTMKAAVKQAIEKIKAEENK